MKQTEGEGSVYPHKFHVDISMTHFVEKYSDLANEQVSDDVLNIAGRVYSKRAMGQKLRFFDLRGESQKVQVMATAKCVFFLNFETIFNLLINIESLYIILKFN